MNDRFFVVCLLVLMALIGILGLLYMDAAATPPPTPAIKMINTTTGNVTALDYNGFAEFIAGAGMTITPNFATSEITFSSGAGSATLEQLSNVTNTGCALNQLLKVNSTAFWNCSNDNTGATTLNELTDVTITGAAYNHILQFLSGQWINKLFAINTQTPLVDFQIIGINNQTGIITTNQFSINSIICGGTDRVSSIDNVTGQVICSAGGGGATTLDSLTDVTITSVAYGHIIQYNQALAQWVNKLFRIDTQTAANDFQIVGINNQTGAITRNQFSVNTVTAGAGDTFVNSIDNATGNVNLKQFSVNSLTCSGTDKLSSINNATGQVICTTDSTGAGGSGIPLPPKKWGELIPKSASTDTIGLVAGCTILATASYVYDTTDNSGAILSTTAITDGINGGIHCTTSNFNVFRGDQNAYLYSKWESNKITTNRLFIGFTSGSTLLPNNADTILDSLIGIGLCIRTTDTLYQFCRNDGDATTDYVSTGITEDTVVHSFEVYTTDAGVNWCGKIDGGSATCWTTEIPTPTTRLYAESTGETDGGATAILWTQYLFYVQNDK